MNKVDMLKVLTTIALLTLAPVMDSAPLVPGEPDVFEEPADGGSENPPDLWRTVVDVEEITARATKILDKLLRTRSMTTFPDGDGNTEAMTAEIIKATSSPNVRDKSLGTDINNPLKTVTTHSDGQEEIPLATSSLDESLRTDLTTSYPDSLQQTEKNSLFRLSEVIDSNKQGKTPTADKQSKSLNPILGGREELVKMLSALEEFHKLMNSTLSNRITIIPRGNGNGRNPGKKNKMVVTDGNLKSTTATAVVSSSTSPKNSTDHMDPKLNGKTSKKSLQSAPKKPNKRVCFWKYCSQN